MTCGYLGVPNISTTLGYHHLDGVADLSDRCPSARLTMLNLVVLGRLNNTGVHVEILRENKPTAFYLSRSLNVIGNNMD